MHSLRWKFAALVVWLAPVHVASAQRLPAPRKLVEELRLDATKEDFPGVGDFAVGPHGQIVVAIDPDQVLRFYDVAGEKVATFGRKGSGPGEFRRIGRLGWLADTLWVSDFELHRITYISPAAKTLRTQVVAANLNEAMRSRTTPAEGSVFMFMPWSVAPHGMMVGPAMITKGRTAAGTIDTRSIVMSVNADGSGQRTIAVPPTTEAAFVNYAPGDGSSFGRAVPFTFLPQTQYAPDGSRLVMLSAEVLPKSATYTVTALRIGAPADTIFSRRFETAPVEISASTKDSAIAAIGGQRPDGRPMYPPAVLDKLRELVRAKMPTVYAPVSGLVVGLDNTTWVLLHPTPSGTPAVALDAKGNPVATIVIPKRARLMQASLSRVWVIESDDDGLDSIVRYRIK